MNQRTSPDRYAKRMRNSPIHRWLLLFLFFIPVSCSAQSKLIKKDNTLKYIATAVRSDGKGYVIRFNMKHKLNSYDFSQPTAYSIQLELYENGIDTTDIELIDHHHIIKNINYYVLKNGIGINLQLTEKGYYRAAAYPDGASNDFLVGLTRTTITQLASNIQSMKPFPWAPAPDSTSLLATKKSPRVSKAYQNIRRKVEFDTVVLDAGHGGFDTGAIGWNHTLEKMWRFR